MGKLTNSNTQSNSRTANLAAPGREFEQRVWEMIERHHPYCTLSNVVLFTPQRAWLTDEESGRPAGCGDHAVEMDHLFHRIHGSEDVLTIVECKDAPVIEVTDKKWMFNSKKGPRNAQDQLRRHARALRAYVNPRRPDNRLIIHGIVVTNYAIPKGADHDQLHQQDGDGLMLDLMEKEKFEAFLEKMKYVPTRVTRSDLLGVLRLGGAVPNLGHPELPNAIAFIDRCRRELDRELYRAFQPTSNCWAIDGFAGMGKSVLLAYSLLVFATDRCLDKDGRDFLSFEKMAAKLGLPPLSERRVYAYALREKQRRVIESQFQLFAGEFMAKDWKLCFGIRRPPIHLWKGAIPSDCNVLLLDEVHDLSADDLKVIADWHQQAPDHYLVVAADRFQKLLTAVQRDVSRRSLNEFVPGVDFERKIAWLRLNYRNPAPIYFISLALLFRWYAHHGNRKTFTKRGLKIHLGINHDTDSSGKRNGFTLCHDSHPGNNWAHCVDILDSCESVLTLLQPHHFRPQDVLWVRFSDEDEYFDYEQLSRFTYHDLSSDRSRWTVEKYVKGQDFPIVVIEGLSANMDSGGAACVERRMWERRQELYICASRATAFLFFVLPRNPPRNASAVLNLRQEIQNLVRELASPRREKRFSRTWRLPSLTRVKSDEPSPEQQLLRSIFGEKS